MKKNYLILLLFFLGTLTTFSQDMKVKGKVSDSKGNALPGANVIIKGSTLVFSYLGFVEQEIKVASNVLNVVLKAEVDNKLNEVVVTAFGMSKKAKSLAYSSQQISTKDIQTSGQTNIMEALQGMVSGVNINKASGGAGGGFIRCWKQ